MLDRPRAQPPRSTRLVIVGSIPPPSSAAGPMPMCSSGTLTSTHGLLAAADTSHVELLSTGILTVILAECYMFVHSRRPRRPLHHYHPRRRRPLQRQGRSVGALPTILGGHALKPAMASGSASLAGSRGVGEGWTTTGEATTPKTSLRACAVRRERGVVFQQGHLCECLLQRGRN